MPPPIPLAERRRLLSRSPLFGALPPADLDRLAARLTERRFARGQLVFGRGDPGSCLLVLVEGRVRVGLTSPEGREVLLAVFGPGEVLGEMALLDGGPRSADAAALDPCLLLSLDRRDLLPVLRASPEAALRLFEIVCGRLRAATERLEGTVLMPVASRLARLLLSLADGDGGEARPGGDRKRGDRVDAALTQGDLGRLVGASRERVNIHLGRWRAEGVLASEGRTLRILNRRRLQTIAETADGWREAA